MTRRKKAYEPYKTTIGGRVVWQVNSAELGFVITFVPKAEKLVAYFWKSCDLILPEGTGVEVEILPSAVLGRVFYPVVELDGEGLEAVPRTTRSLCRSEAIAANPALAEVKIQPQILVTLPVVRKQPFP